MTDRDALRDDLAALVRDLLHERVVPGEPGRPSLRAVLEDHLGVPVREIEVLAHHLPAHRLADADLALDRLAEESAAPARIVGIGGGDERHHRGLADLLANEAWGAVPVGPVDHQTEPTGPTTVRRVVAMGVRLLTFEDAPVAVVQRAAVPQYGRNQVTLELLTRDRETAERLVDRVTDLMWQLSVLRGQVLGFTETGYGASAGGLTFLPRPELAREDVVLPAGVLAVVDQHVLHTDAQRALLRRHGQHLKRGLLLHGPPGTGKTHLVRYLIGRATSATVILLAGTAFGAIAEAAALARALAPAVVVLEDVDLVAADRAYTPGGNPLLFAVLDALDGLDADADVAFLMTTNRADLLEEALVQRPGRVDLAVRIDRPQLPEWRRLLSLYAGDLPFGGAVLDEVAERCAGTTASFVKELVRRSLLRGERHGVDPDVPGALDEHLRAAAEELMTSAGELTRAVLGGREGDAAREAVNEAGRTSGADGPTAGWFAYAPLSGTRFDPPSR